MGDISDETNNSHVSVGPEDLLLAADDVRGGLVHGQPHEERVGGVTGGLAEILPSVTQESSAEMQTPVLAEHC